MVTIGLIIAGVLIVGTVLAAVGMLLALRVAAGDRSGPPTSPYDSTPPPS